MCCPERLSSRVMATHEQIGMSARAPAIGPSDNNRNLDWQISDKFRKMSPEFILPSE
jgi:hypothetical protein